MEDRGLNRFLDRPFKNSPSSIFLMFLLLAIGALKVFGHYEARAIVGPFKLDFIHQCADYLK